MAAMHQQPLPHYNNISSSHNSTRHLKEAFVSNLSGSSMLEIVALSVIVPVLIVLRQLTCSNDAWAKKSDHPYPLRKRWTSYTLSLLEDYVFIILPILSVLTVLNGWLYTCAIVLSFLLILIVYVESSWFTSPIHGQSHAFVRNNISSYRVAMMVVTCICILAVDFKIFPRRYAKTETYGTGLMDLGVGSFVVANALVSQQARNAMSTKLKSACRSAIPLVLLGTGRLISTAGVDYQVHVGEYGVHWNFFFTLAAVSLLSSLISVHPRYCGILGLFTLLVYQVCLSCGLNVYLLSNNRGLDLISQNKEGLFSIFGYWAMYLIGVFLGYMLFFGGGTMSRVLNNINFRIKVWGLTVFFWIATVILDKHIERVSRRMCNMAYVSLVFAQNLQVLSILMLADFVPRQGPLVLEEAFNQNLLGSFLWANILTGIVNLNVDTLSASSFTSFCILLGYSSILSGSVGLAAFFGIRLKF